MKFENNTAIALFSIKMALQTVIIFNYQKIKTAVLVDDCLSDLPTPKARYPGWRCML